MKVYTSRKNLNSDLSLFKKGQKAIGFVPTMGALHQGHLSLVKQGLADNDMVVVSIFVNPTQFDNSDDLEKYPRTLDRDVSLLETVSKDAIVVYAPTVADIYTKKVTSEHFTFDGLEFEMEGRFRNGHFDGVGTIVKRLFQIVEPTRAYFGEKDFQQLVAIRRMVDDLNLAVEIVGMPIYREEDGLAMSSRNKYLTPPERQAAHSINHALRRAGERFSSGERSAGSINREEKTIIEAEPLAQIDYVNICDTKTLHDTEQITEAAVLAVAVNIGKARLIDNRVLDPSP